MSLNGFLSTIELRLDRPGVWVASSAAFCPVRAVCTGSGEWTLFAADGRGQAAQLAGGWLFAAGRVIGLVWRLGSGISVKVVVYKGFHTDQAQRRLIVRIRYRLPTAARFA